MLGDVLGFLGRPLVIFVGPLGGPLGPWRSGVVPREIPGGPWGGAKRDRKHKDSLGASGESEGALGVILVVWGGP